MRLQTIPVHVMGFAWRCELHTTGSTCPHLMGDKDSGNGGRTSPAHVYSSCLKWQLVKDTPATEGGVQVSYPNHKDSNRKHPTYCLPDT